MSCTDPPRPGWEPDDPNCELCEAARFTHWYFEDELCWVADCEVCATPMVVWKRHGTEPPAAELDAMLARLKEVGEERFGPGGGVVDQVMRQIPDHFHAHYRDADWMSRRWVEPPSRYVGVGAPRVTGSQMTGSQMTGSQMTQRKRGK